MAHGFKQEGNAIDFYNGTGSTISRLTVTEIGTKWGVVPYDVPDGSRGVYLTNGIFELPASLTGNVAAWAPLYWDGSALTDNPTGNIVGLAVPMEGKSIDAADAAGDSSSTTARVWIR